MVEAYYQASLWSSSIEAASKRYYKKVSAVWRLVFSQRIMEYCPLPPILLVRPLNCSASRNVLGRTAITTYIPPAFSIADEVGMSKPRPCLTLKMKVLYLPF
jgi:hypothetical protein